MPESSSSSGTGTSSSSSGGAQDPMGAILPKPPTPLYPDVPWWAVLIAAFVFAFLGVVVGAYFFREGFGGIGTGKASSIVVDTISYIPHIILLFGVLADMFTLQGVWSIPSLVGLLSIFGDYVFQYFWKGIDELTKQGKGLYDRATAESANKNSSSGPAKNPSGAPSSSSPFGGLPRGNQMRGGKKQRGGVDPPAAKSEPTLFKGYNGCDIQGFDTFKPAVPYTAQTLVVTATVFSYYCFDLIRNRGWINSIAAILAFLSTFIAEVVIIDFQNPNGCGEGGFSAIAQGVRSFFEGLLFGGVSYGIVQTYAPTRLPSSTISPFPRKSVGDLSPGPDGRMYDRDGYPFVVLPNGQAVPDISDAASRAAFGQLAGTSSGVTTSLGSGCPGVAASCPNAR